MWQIIWYLIICLSIFFVSKKPSSPPKQAEDRFYTKCVFSTYMLFARASDLKSDAFLPTGYRDPVIIPPHTILYLMEVRNEKGEIWLKVCGLTTAGYEYIGWIKRSNL